MKSKLLRSIKLASTWVTVFVASIIFMMAYVIEPILSDWLSHTTGWLLNTGPLSLLLLGSAVLISVCFALSYRLASLVISTISGRPTIRLEN
jgi:uncharacterized membrane protein